MKAVRILTIAAVTLFSAVSSQATGNRAEWKFAKGKGNKSSVEFLQSGRYTSLYDESSAISFVGARRSTKHNLSVKDGMPVVENSTKDDYWMFEMPVTNLAAGTVVDFWGMFFCNPCSVPHEFALEYNDGGKWRSVCDCLSTLSDKHPRRLWTSVRLSKPIKKGAVRFRIRQTEQTTLSTRLGGSSSGQSPQIICYDASIPRDTLKILFLGNSYTYYSLYPIIFKEIAWHEGHYADCSIFISGGYTMKAHLGNSVCRETVEKGGYDYAFLQDQSFNPVLIDTEDDRAVVDNLCKMVKRVRTYSPNVSTILELTWGRKFGGNNLGDKYAYLPTKYPEYFSDYNAMQNRLTAMTYHEAEITGSQVSPVGVAWQIVRRERPDIELYFKDAHHPSYAGAYLSAVVAYMTIYKEPFHNSTDCRLDSATAAYLRDVAQRVVLASEK